jgi:hypothetical protein
MICSQLHDFIRGTTIALPHPGTKKSIDPSHWDIVRPNESADRMVLRHLKSLEAIKGPDRPKIAKH